MFLFALGYETYLLPPQKFGLLKSFTPYIFTHKEILEILRVTDTIQKTAGSPYMHLVLPVLFRMLYSCGLRISEALNLLNADVNLEDGILTIKNAKFNNDRLIPMSDSLSKICRKYANTLHFGAGSSNYFFPAPDKSKLSIYTAYQRFRKILWQSDISHGGRGKGPRLHDFRH